MLPHSNTRISLPLSDPVLCYAVLTGRKTRGKCHLLLKQETIEGILTHEIIPGKTNQIFLRFIFDPEFTKLLRSSSGSGPRWLF